MEDQRTLNEKVADLESRVAALERAKIEKPPPKQLILEKESFTHAQHKKPEPR